MSKIDNRLQALEAQVADVTARLVALKAQQAHLERMKALEAQAVALLAEMNALELGGEG